MDVTRIPKIELHLHLDGTVPPETMWRMAQEKHVALPVGTLDEFYAWLVRTADCRDVNTYLARFELPLQLMQDAPSITRITYDVLARLARQGHVYDEVRFAPQLHTRAGLRQRQNRKIRRTVHDGEQLAVRTEHTPHFRTPLYRFIVNSSFAFRIETMLFVSAARCAQIAA